MSLLPAGMKAQLPSAKLLIMLDPAHGGPDPGARLAGSLPEKTVTLAFASRLRGLLTAGGFSVVSTRDSDPIAPVTTDQRAEFANHLRPSACIILHATASGTGIHLATSELPPPDEAYDADVPHHPVPWNTAQSASVSQSLALANDLGAALVRAKLPVLLMRASVRPLDNLTCPAVALEIGPLSAAGSDPTPATDGEYQQQIAQAIVSALSSWRIQQSASAGVSH